MIYFTVRTITNTLVLADRDAPFIKPQMCPMCLFAKARLARCIFCSFPAIRTVRTVQIYFDATASANRGLRRYLYYPLADHLRTIKCHWKEFRGICLRHLRTCTAQRAHLAREVTVSPMFILYASSIQPFLFLYSCIRVFRYPRNIFLFSREH
jgi:hypothetical protein